MCFPGKDPDSLYEAAPNDTGRRQGAAARGAVNVVTAEENSGARSVAVPLARGHLRREFPAGNGDERVGIASDARHPTAELKSLHHEAEPGLNVKVRPLSQEVRGLPMRELASENRASRGGNEPRAEDSGWAEKLFERHGDVHVLW